MDFVLKGQAGKDALGRWISWARRCRIPAFVALQRRIVKHRAAIDAALDSDLSNALIESTNTKIRLITRVAFGFHGSEPLISLAMLSLGSHPQPSQAGTDPRISQEGLNCATCPPCVRPPGVGARDRGIGAPVGRPSAQPHTCPANPLVSGRRPPAPHRHVGLRWNAHWKNENTLQESFSIGLDQGVWRACRTLTSA